MLTKRHSAFGEMEEWHHGRYIQLHKASTASLALSWELVVLLPNSEIVVNWEGRFFLVVEREFYFVAVKK